MSGNDGFPPLSKRQERILRAVLPIGIALLVLWVVWMGVGLLILPEGSGIGWVSAAIGLSNALLLIVTGYLYRRDLDRRKS